MEARERWPAAYFRGPWAVLPVIGCTLRSNRGKTNMYAYEGEEIVDGGLDESLS